MKKILIILLFSINNSQTSEQKIPHEDIELSELVNTSDDNLESERSLSSRSASTLPSSRFTPKQMAEAYGDVKNIKSQASRSPSTSPSKTSLSGSSTPTVDFFPRFDFSTTSLPCATLVKKFEKPEYPKFIYPVQHVFQGSGGGGKHFIDEKNLKEEAIIADHDLPFVRNMESKQLMGMVSLNMEKTKAKFSSIFPLGNSTEEIHEKLLMLDFQNPYAKGKIFFKDRQKKALIMEFNGYFIVIDLDDFKLESLKDLLVANSIYPLFHLKAITEEDLSTPEKLIQLVNYSILQEDGQWSDNVTAQITSEELNHFLQRALSGEEFKKYALACSADNILINMPYNFTTNEVNLEFETHGQNLQKTMYKITIEIPKSIAYKIDPKSTDYCAILTS